MKLIISIIALFASLTSFSTKLEENQKPCEAYWSPYIEKAKELVAKFEQDLADNPDCASMKAALQAARNRLKMRKDALADCYLTGIAESTQRNEWLNW